MSSTKEVTIWIGRMATAFLVGLSLRLENQYGNWAGIHGRKTASP